MRCHLLAIGRARPGPASQIFQRYAGRLSPPLTLPAGTELYPNCFASVFDLSSYSSPLKPYLEVGYSAV